MKNIFYILIAAFSLLLHAKCVGQNNIVYGAGISYTNGVPTFVPPSKSARVAIDTVTSKWYEYATPGGWRWSGDRVQDISGCATPAYTPGKAQSRLVLNACTEAQNGHGPELYKYTGSAWLCLNCGGDYTAGAGIDITGTEITNTAPDQVVSITGAGINAVTGTYPNFTVTGTEVDGSISNELQTLSVAGNNLTISDGNTVTIPTPSSTLDALTDVAITAPANNQILQYNSAGSQWVNATLAAITGSIGTGQIAYGSASGVIAGNSNFFYNSSNGRVGIGTGSPSEMLNIDNSTNNARIKINTGLASGESQFALYAPPFYYVNVTQLGGSATGTTAGISNAGLSTLTSFSSGILFNCTNGFTAFATAGAERMRILAAGNVAIGATSATDRVTIDGAAGYSSFRIIDTYTPTGTADFNGNVGSFAWDENYLYIKTAAGWKRSALSTF